MPQKITMKTSHTLPVRVICDNVRDPGNMGAILRVAASVGCTEVILIKGCTDPWDSKVLRSASGGHFHVPIKMDMTWQEAKESLDSAGSIFLAENNIEKTLQPSRSLSKFLYYQPNYASLDSIVVIIGGETEGVSDAAYAMASKRNGSRVYIPLSNGMESLNSGSALSVLLFEIKRQFLLSQDFKINHHQSTDTEEGSGDVDQDKSRTASSGG